MEQPTGRLLTQEDISAPTTKREKESYGSMSEVLFARQRDLTASEKDKQLRELALAYTELLRELLRLKNTKHQRIVEEIFEELDSDCPHRIMATEKEDVSLLKKRECPQCVEALKARYLHKEE